MHLKKESTPQDLIFSNRALRLLIIPLMIEQFLAITIGMADSMMVSNVGEAAISGVNLVDSINNFLISMFSALATGGTVVVSQYLGHKERENAVGAAKQLLLSVTALSLFIMCLTLVGNRTILGWIYQSVEE